jgi:hypothetical protein
MDLTGVPLAFFILKETNFRSYRRRKNLQNWKRKLNSTVNTGDPPFTLVRVLQRSARELSQATRVNHALDESELAVSLYYLDEDQDKNAIVIDRDLDAALRDHADRDQGSIKIYAKVSHTSALSARAESTEVGSTTEPLRTIPPVASSFTLNLPNPQGTVALSDEEKESVLFAMTHRLAIALVTMDTDFAINSLSPEQLQAAFQVADKLKEVRDLFLCTPANSGESNAPDPSAAPDDENQPSGSSEAPAYTPNNRDLNEKAALDAIGRSLEALSLAPTEGLRNEAGTKSVGSSTDDSSDFLLVDRSMVDSVVTTVSQDNPDRWAHQLEQLRDLGFWDVALSVKVLDTLMEQHPMSAVDDSSFILRAVETLLSIRDSKGQEDE